MRPTRVFYVENDPVLRSLMARMLDGQPELHLIGQAGSSDEALASQEAGRADVALVDLALGAASLNGVDLGLALRERLPDIGIVIFSQHQMDHLHRRVPRAQRMGWSFVQKSGDMQISDLVDTLRATARGASIGATDSQAPTPGSSVLDAMTGRQRAVMGLAAAGLTAPQIAARLNLSADTVRQDLSKAYRVLVPDEAEGGDLRTQAVLAYVKLVEAEPWGTE